MSAISKLEIVLASEPSVTLVAIANLFAVTAQTAENHCWRKGRCDTYNGEYLNGGKSYGGYATHHRAP